MNPGTCAGVMGQRSRREAEPSPAGRRDSDRQLPTEFLELMDRCERRQGATPTEHRVEARAERKLAESSSSSSREADTGAAACAGESHREPLSRPPWLTGSKGSGTNRPPRVAEAKKGSVSEGAAKASAGHVTQNPERAETGPSRRAGSASDDDQPADLSVAALQSAAPPAKDEVLSPSGEWLGTQSEAGQQGGNREEAEGDCEAEAGVVAGEGAPELMEPAGRTAGTMGENQRPAEALRAGGQSLPGKPVQTSPASGQPGGVLPGAWPEKPSVATISEPELATEGTASKPLIMQGIALSEASPAGGIEAGRNGAGTTNAAEDNSMKSAPKGNLIDASLKPGKTPGTKADTSAIGAALKDGQATLEAKARILPEEVMNPGVAAGLMALSDSSTTVGLHEAAEASTTTASTAAGQAGRLDDLLMGHVLHVKRASLDAVAVVVRPDANTELFLDIRQRGGQVEVFIRCEQGEAASLREDWGRLEQSLAAQGARLAPLNEPPPPRGQGLPGSGQAGPGYSDADTRRRSSRPTPVVLDDLPMVGSVTEPLRRRSVRSLISARQGWELWA